MSAPAIADWMTLAPEAALAGCAAILLALDLVRPAGARFCVRWGLIGALGSLAALAYLRTDAPDSFGGLLAQDGLAVAGRLLVLGSLAAVLLISYPSLESSGFPPAEYTALLMLSAAALMGACSAQDLLVLVILLEASSAALAAAMGAERGSRASREAALKYFLLSVFASAFIVYGAAMLFLAGGKFSMVLPPAAGPAGLVGVLFVLAGMAFKCALVPFHMWAPDAYEGARIPVAAYLATASKAAGFIVLARYLSMCRILEVPGVGSAAWAVSAASMAGGTLLALTQANLKRMMAYSGVAHAGFMLAALLGPSGASPAALLAYLGAYVLMAGCAFAVLAGLEVGGAAPTVESLAGLARRSMPLALALGVAMVALTGIPPTAGFVAKFAALREAFAGGHVLLVLIGVAASLVSAGFYLRLLVPAFMEEGEGARRGIRAGAGALVVAVGAAVLVVVLGLAPGLLLGLARFFTGE